MTDRRIVNLARTLVHYSIKVKKGQFVVVRGYPYSPEAMPLFREIYREVLHVGGHPRNYLQRDPDLAYVMFSEASDEQLTYMDPAAELLAEEMDCRITVLAANNTRYLSTIDPSREGLWRRAQSDFVKRLLERTAAGEFRWNATLFPTNAYAQDAEMSLEEFEDFVYSTTYADTEDPIAKWEEIHNQQQRLVDWLAGKKKLQVRGPNVELDLSIEGRPFENCDGTKNMPDGEIFTSPVEDSVNGWVRFTYPAIREGREVEGVELTFEQGRIVKASAKKNEAFLLGMLDVDAGARYLGEFSIATNKRIDRFIKNILFDEKIGGTIHMAVGYGFPETLSQNKSSIHWDMICDMRDGGQITVDGELVYDSGEFKI